MQALDKVCGTIGRSQLPRAIDTRPDNDLSSLDQLNSAPFLLT